MNENIFNDKTLAVAEGMIVSNGATLAIICREDPPVSARKAIGSLIGTSVVQAVWFFVARDVWHLVSAWSLVGSALIGAIGGITILKAAAHYGEWYGRKKAREFINRDSKDETKESTRHD
jgi:hypothetical protein